MASEATSPVGARTTDREAAITALEEQLARTPRATRPYEHAAVAYRLGLAYAEAPRGDPAQSLRKALACYDVAAAIFDPRFDPVEHARVLNAAGAAHRSLGDRRRAASLFEKAADLLEGRERDAERAAALNNLGLARTELGDITGAVDAFDAAVELFDTTTAEGRRGRIATLHNRGAAHAAAGTEEAMEAALADYEAARAELDLEEAPYHYGLLEHSIGVACSALAAMRAKASGADDPGGDSEREQLLAQAVDAFRESLTVFTRRELPFQHALAKHNLGLAQANLGGLTNRRRALMCFEDAVAALDPRLHGDAWRQAYASLERVEKELTADVGEASRPAHVAALLARVSDEERTALLRERLLRFLDLPAPRASASIGELVFAAAKIGGEAEERILRTVLEIVMELPADRHELTIRAIFNAHRQLPDDERERADLALDAAVGEALAGPQRIFVRDFLYSLGWERP